MQPPPSLYPIHVTQARYGGTYEAGKWLASHDPLPEDATGGDEECNAFFDSPAAGRVGRGRTPDQAVNDLLERWHNDGQPFDYMPALAGVPVHTTPMTPNDDTKDSRIEGPARPMTQDDDRAVTIAGSDLTDVISSITIKGVVWGVGAAEPPECIEGHDDPDTKDRTMTEFMGP